MGHLLAAVYALKTYELDEVWFAPSKRHPFDKPLAPFKDRMEMCRLLVKGFTSCLKVTPIEADPGRDGRTLHTLLALRKKHPAHHFSLILGSDLLRETKKWYRFGEIRDRFMVLVVPRGAMRNGRPAIPDISSRKVRRSIKKGEGLGGLLTPDVAAYVLSRGLYVAETRSIQPPPSSSSSR
jgi:nicotinate-nucleotide adenylyltransferase